MSQKSHNSHNNISLTQKWGTKSIYRNIYLLDLFYTPLFSYLEENFKEEFNLIEKKYQKSKHIKEGLSFILYSCLNGRNEHKYANEEEIAFSLLQNLWKEP